MIFNQADFSADIFYALMIQAIIPRPIAWVLTQNPSGGFNVAPFSFFNGVASEPPLLMISVGRKDEATRKDTWVNIAERNDFVVHIPPGEMAEAIVATSKSLPFNESELDLARLETIPVEGEALPRIKGPRVAIFCRKYRIIEVGPAPQGLILGEIKKIWVEDDAFKKQDGKIIFDSKKINPLTRLGGREYGILGNIFSLNRPK